MGKVGDSVGQGVRRGSVATKKKKKKTRSPSYSRLRALRAPDANNLPHLPIQYR